MFLNYNQLNEQNNFMMFSSFFLFFLKLRGFKAPGNIAVNNFSEMSEILKNKIEMCKCNHRVGSTQNR